METHIEFWKNIPFFCIMISMFSGTVSSMLKKEAAKWLNAVVMGSVVIMSAILLVHLMKYNGCPVVPSRWFGYGTRTWICPSGGCRNGKNPNFMGKVIDNSGFCAKM